MNIEHKKQLLNLLNGYCDDNHCVVIGQGRYCNNKCRFNCPVMYCINSHGTGCPVMDIRKRI